MISRLLGLSRRFGTLPFLWLAWFVYALFLVFKVGIIFSTYVDYFESSYNSSGCDQGQIISTNHTSSEMEPVLKLGPNLLKVAVGSCALVFIIILQVNRNHVANLPCQLPILFEI